MVDIFISSAGDVYVYLYIISKRIDTLRWEPLKSVTCTLTVSVFLFFFRPASGVHQRRQRDGAVVLVFVVCDASRTAARSGVHHGRLRRRRRPLRAGGHRLLAAGHRQDAHVQPEQHVLVTVAARPVRGRRAPSPATDAPRRAHATEPVHYAAPLLVVVVRARHQAVRPQQRRQQQQQQQQRLSGTAAAHLRADRQRTTNASARPPRVLVPDLGSGRSAVTRFWHARQPSSVQIDRDSYDYIDIFFFHLSLLRCTLLLTRTCTPLQLYLVCTSALRKNRDRITAMPVLLTCIARRARRVTIFDECTTLIFLRGKEAKNTKKKKN